MKDGFESEVCTGVVLRKDDAEEGVTELTIPDLYRKVGLYHLYCLRNDM